MFLTTESVIYLSIVVIGLELVMMMYVYQLRPEERSNRLFAVYMLILAISGSGALILGTTQSLPMARFGGWLQATTALAAGPLLWLLTFLVYRPDVWRRRAVVYGLIGLAILPVLLMSIDFVAGTKLLFDFTTAEAGPGYVSMSSYLSGAAGPLFFYGNVVILNALIGLPLLAFALSRQTPWALRRATWILVAAVVLAGLVTGTVRNASPALASMTGPAVIAIVTGWVITRYGVLSPLAIAFKQAINTAHFGLLVFDRTGNLLEANGAAVRLLGLPDLTDGRQRLATVLEQLAAQVVQPELSLPLPPAESQPGHTFRTELHLAANGRVPERYLTLHLEPIRDPDQQHIGTLCSIVDLTSERQAQARLLQANEVISRRAAELGTVTHISSTLRTATTVDEMLPTLLRQALQAAKADKGVIFLVEGQTGDLVARVCQPPLDNLSALRHRPGQGITGHVAVTGKVHAIETPLEDPRAQILAPETSYWQDVRHTLALPLITPEQTVGVMHVARCEARPFSVEDTRLLTTISDIAANALHRARMLEMLEQRVAERTHELVATNLRLQELDVLKSKFIADISHELRTPVTHLNLYIDLLARGKAEKRPEYLAVLRAKTSRLVHLIEDILNVSRLDMLRQGEVKLTAVDLNETIAAALAIHRLQAEVAGLSLVFEPEEAVPPVRAERNQLLQAITHLINNAINYTPAGEIRLRTWLDEGRGQVCLQVADSGIGVEHEDLPHIFDRFYRGRRVGQSNIAGTGLGLAVVKEILDLHNSTIEVDSRVGEGTVFTVWLHLAE